MITTYKNSGTQPRIHGVEEGTEIQTKGRKTYSMKI
jgi:hypothetical protein